MDSEQMLVNWLLETLQNGSSWLLFNHNVLTKTATRNLATHECGSINEIRSIRHFHFCINQKWKYIKYSLENQFSIFFWCGSMHCVWVTRTLVWALESVLDRKSRVFSARTKIFFSATRRAPTLKRTPETCSHGQTTPEEPFWKKIHLQTKNHLKKLFRQVFWTLQKKVAHQHSQE